MNCLFKLFGILAWIIRSGGFDAKFIYLLIINNKYNNNMSEFLLAFSERASTFCIAGILCFVSFLYSKGERERERNVLFNDALNTFYLRLYGVRNMVKDHSDSDKGNPLPPHRLLLSISSKGSFICTIPQTG